MTPSGMKILSCPDCGYRVSGLEGACPRCGKAFDKDSKFECPFCGTLVPASADSCPSCQIDYIDFSSKAEKKLLDKAMDKILEELDELMEPGEGEPVCPKCSSPLEKAGSKCPHCGFGPKTKDRPPKAEEPPEPDGPTDALCPICGAWVKSDDPSCRECGAEFIADEGETIEEEEQIYCPVCDSAVGLEMAICPHCGAEFEEEEEPEPEVIEAPAIVEKAPSLREAAKKAIDERDGIPPPPPRDIPERPKTPPKRIITREKAPRRAPTRVIPRPKAVAKQVAKAGKGGEVVTPRRDKQAIEQRGLSNGAGIINGKGQVNGRHFINGMGAVNGRDMVNGTGFINGKESGGGLFGRRRYKFITKMRWQFLAVLVAILITVPTFMYLSHLRSQSPYSVDGDFGDWDDSTIFTVMTESSVPSTNVVEWSTDSHNTELYLYARTEQNLMASGNAERIALFIDIDGSDDSGYLVGDVGADYMFDILGWNGSVRSSSVSEFHSDDGDQLDWSAWRVVGSVTSRVVESEIEAMAKLPVQTNESTRLVLTTQTEDEICCVSYAVPLKGGLLVVEQMPVPEVAISDVLIQDAEAGFLRLRFSSQGEGGNVDAVTPSLVGVGSYSTIAPFSLEVGETRVVDMRIDSSQLAPEDYVSANVTADGISSSFSRVQIVGHGASAYCVSPPSEITVDGAFGDWIGKTVKDADDLPLVNQNINIDEVGAERSSTDAFFYLSVYGELCAGVYIPKACAIPSGSGTGPVITERKTAEDYVRIYIDADRSTTTGELVSLGTMTIGADYTVDISGVNCEIKSASISTYFAGTWIELSFQADAAKDEKRMEIGIPSASIGSPADVDFIIEMTDWRGGQDLATNVSVGGMRSWVVDSDTTSTEATSMSYQRKIFYDGTNYWSIFSDGSDTLCKYSSDGGETWTLNGEDDGLVFADSNDVAEASLWYDADNDAVYVVGDRSTATTNVYIQKGTVYPSTPSIDWSSSDVTLSVSTVSIGGKNAFICRDTSGYLWILSSEQSQVGPIRYDLITYQSTSVNNIAAWTSRGTLLAEGSTVLEMKGSILPAGSGSQVWAVYNHESYVDARKYSGSSWDSIENVYTDTGSLGFVDTAPASAVVDEDGVVHVVYGDASKDGQVEKPQIQYRYRSSAGWSSPLELDADDTSVAHYYPTISLDTSTGNVYALWLETTGYNIACKKNVSGSWSFVSLSGQTSYAKQHLTSIYSVSGESYVCWQWTQNTTGNIEVMFNAIPEFDDLVIPILMIIAIFFVGVHRRRRDASVER